MKKKFKDLCDTCKFKRCQSNNVRVIGCKDYKSKEDKK